MSGILVQSWVSIYPFSNRNRNGSNGKKLVTGKSLSLSSQLKNPLSFFLWDARKILDSYILPQGELIELHHFALWGFLKNFAELIFALGTFKQVFRKETSGFFERAFNRHFFYLVQTIKNNDTKMNFDIIEVKIKKEKIYCWQFLLVFSRELIFALNTQKLVSLRYRS